MTPETITRTGLDLGGKVNLVVVAAVAMQGKNEGGAVLGRIGDVDPILAIQAVMRKVDVLRSGRRSQEQHWKKADVLHPLSIDACSLRASAIFWIC